MDNYAVNQELTKSEMNCNEYQYDIAKLFNIELTPQKTDLI